MRGLWQKLPSKVDYEKTYENTLPGTGMTPAVFVKRPSESKVSWGSKFVNVTRVWSTYACLWRDVLKKKMRKHMKMHTDKDKNLRIKESKLY